MSVGEKEKSSLRISFYIAFSSCINRESNITVDRILQNFTECKANLSNSNVYLCSMRVIIR